MTNSKLLRVVLSLDEMEVSQFSKFITSPYFNERKELILFWELLSVQKNDLAKDWKEIFFKKIFSKKQYNDAAMRKLMNQLNDLIKKFLVVHYQEKDAWLNKKTLLVCYGQKNLNKEFKETLNTLKNDTSIAIEYSYDTSLELFKIFKLYYNHPSTSKLKCSDEILAEAMNKLDQFYISEKLHFTTEQLNRQVIFTRKNAIPFLEEIKNHAKKGKKKNSIYELYLALQSLMEQGYNRTSFSKCELLFSQNKENITPEKRYAILYFMINIVNRGINLGHIQLAKKNLELYKLGIKEKILIYNNRITYETFTNVVIFSTNLGERKYATDFIKKYSKNLETEHKQEVIYFSEALVSFYSKEYLDTVKQLTAYKHDGGFFDIRAKSFLIRALVEQYLLDQNYFILFISKTDTIDRYFRRKEEELGGENINGYSKLLSYSVKFVKLLQRGKKDPKHWDTLTNKVKNEKILYARKWLLDNIESVQ